MVDIIKPQWNAPAHIHAFTTTRNGGYSDHPYDSLNLSDYINDQPQNVKTNRELLKECLDLPSEPIWLNQVHGKKIVCADLGYPSPPDADGSFAKLSNKVCIVLTADCLPVLITNKEGTMVAALHCGWKGLAANIIHECLSLFNNKNAIAWLGPAISPKVYEVSEELKQIFVALNPLYENAFIFSRPKHFFMDLYEIARLQLQAKGIEEITGGYFCTFQDKKHFFSYRRDQGLTGRMATGIWISEY